MEDEVRLALRDLFEAIEQKGDCLPSLARLDALKERGRGVFDARLQHFLDGRSYQKALAHLEGRATERGSCGR